MPHDRLTTTEQEARHQLLTARERLGRAAALKCSLAELDTLDAAVARATDGWSRDRRVALALRVQKEARQTGHSRGRAAYLFLLDCYQRLGQAPPVSEPGRPEPPRQLPLALSDDPCSSRSSRRPPPAGEAVPDQQLARSGGVGEETLWKIAQGSESSAGPTRRRQYAITCRLACPQPLTLQLAWVQYDDPARAT